MIFLKHTFSKNSIDNATPNMVMNALLLPLLYNTADAIPPVNINNARPFTFFETTIHMV